MTKICSIMFLLLFFMSCENAHDSSAPSQEIYSKDDTETTSPGVSDSEPNSPFPGEGALFNANISFTNFGLSDEEKVHRAIDIIKTVIASDEFKSQVLNFTYNGVQKFVGTTLSNAQVYQRILEGKEELKPEVDYEMDLDLELYYDSSSTVGYTYPSALRIWMNTKFFDPYTPSEVAGNIFHEWTHKLGFKHATAYSVSRKSSVPYALGYLIRDLGRQYE